MKLKNIKTIAVIKISALFMLAILPALFISAPAFATVPSTYTPGAKVSFTFDDGLSSALLAAQTLKTYGYSATDYVITGCVGVKSGTLCGGDTAENHMTSSEIASLVNSYGWEIGSHSITHPLLAAVDNPAMTPTLLNSELAQSQLALQTSGFNAFSFATPFGDYDNQVIATAAKYYSTFRTFQDLTFDGATSPTFPYYYPHNSFPYNNYLLTVTPVQGNVPVATVKSYIDQAKANNQWLILVLHDIKADNDTTYNAAESAYEYKAGDLASIAAYVKSLSIPVVNMSAGLPAGVNVMPNSGFDSGISAGWTTDAPTKIVADSQGTTASGHGSFDGTSTGPLKSVSLTGNTTDGHLFSPLISVVFGRSYTFENYVNLTSTSGEIDLYVDEYNASGTDLKTGSYIRGILGSTVTTNVQAGSINFTYTPTSSSVAAVRLQVAVHGAGAVAYVDNLKMLSPDGTEKVFTPGTPGVAGTADLNGDGVVNAIDLSVVLANWNQSGKTTAQGDINQDGIVNAIDLSTILSGWSK